VILRAGDVLTFRTPGGGGHGDPGLRAPADVARDRMSGLVTANGPSATMDSSGSP
jgi:N-methylhydantoinase B